VVLGGASFDAPNGEPQLGRAGDRVMLGGRLYHRGLAGFVVCTGTSGLGTRGRDASETAALLLADLNIPEERIIRTSGRNTKEEMEELRRLIDQRQWRRVGLITSAWHMRRAMRLAKAVGLDLAPLPADFRSEFPDWNPVLLIPNSQAFDDTNLACKELMAGLVGR
jgi:uncharacterized SAM-binding protein YcdF (DUF218 family)